MIINWNNKDILLINADDFSTTTDFFKNVIHITIGFNKDLTDKKITKYIDQWYNKYDFKTIIIKTDNDIYLLENGYPKIVIIGMNSHITSGDFVFNEVTNITRKYKIKKILN